MGGLLFIAAMSLPYPLAVHIMKDPVYEPSPIENLRDLVKSGLKRQEEVLKKRNQEKRDEIRGKELVELERSRCRLCHALKGLHGQGLFNHDYVEPDLEECEPT